METTRRARRHILNPVRKYMHTSSRGMHICQPFALLHSRHIVEKCKLNAKFSQQAVLDSSLQMYKYRVHSRSTFDFLQTCRTAPTPRGPLMLGLALYAVLKQSGDFTEICVMSPFGTETKLSFDVHSHVRAATC